MSVFLCNFAAMRVKTEAIVLHSLKYGESKLIVEMFTREAGRLSVAVPVPKSSKSRWKKQYFQPMTLLTIETDLRQRMQLQKLTDARLSMPYASVPFSPEKLAITLFVAEFLYHGLRSEQRNELLFDYVSDSMQWLDAATQGYANFHLTFLMRLSRFLGFYPNLDDYSEGCVFDLRSGCFSTVVPVHRDFLPPAEARLIHQLMRMDFPTMHLFQLSHNDRNRITAVLLQYYQQHIPDFPELRSLGVLRELWC